MQLYARASVVAVATRPNLHMSGLTVSLESMATARPVVLTRTPGVEDYVDDGDNARLVPTEAPEDLADAVVELLDDPAAAHALGLRARAAIEDRLTSVHLVDNMAAAVRPRLRPSASAARPEHPADTGGVPAQDHECR